MDGALALGTEKPSDLLCLSKSPNFTIQFFLNAQSNFLLPLLKSSDPTLRNASVRLAGEWKQSTAVAALAEFAGNAEDETLRRESLDALRLIGGARTVEELKKLAALLLS